MWAVGWSQSPGSCSWNMANFCWAPNTCNPMGIAPVLTWSTWRNTGTLPPSSTLLVPALPLSPSLSLLQPPWTPPGIPGSSVASCFSSDLTHFLAAPAPYCYLSSSPALCLKWHSCLICVARLTHCNRSSEHLGAHCVCSALHLWPQEQCLAQYSVSSGEPGHRGVCF